MMNEPDKLTPMMRQYKEIKDKNPGHILFYRLGDFYEMFFEDAKAASSVLNLTLTTRGKHMGEEIPLAGFPHHQLNNYLSRMIKAGYKVAVCDQTENPKYAKGIVKRGVTEIVTAGTAVTDEIIDRNSNNYIVCIFRGGDGRTGMAAADISTGEFSGWDSEEDGNGLEEMISMFDPSEILMPRSFQDHVRFEKRTVTLIENHRFDPSLSSKVLTEYYKIAGTVSLGFKEADPSAICAGVLLEYINGNVRSSSFRLNRLRRFVGSDYCSIDYRTRRNLEILEPVSSDGNRDATLYSVMNGTRTPMGARLLRKWLTRPLMNKDEINRRLEVTEALFKDRQLRKKLAKTLSGMADIERLAGKTGAGRIRPDELVRLKESLKLLPGITELLASSDSVHVKELADKFVPADGCVSIIERAVREPETVYAGEKRYVKKGWSKELDELYEILDNGKDKLLRLAEKVKGELNIPTLKISYNKVFGYYFEVTKKYSELIPDGFIRKQTLVNSERFINQELKDFEENILNADDRIEELEKAVYSDILAQVSGHTETVRTNAAAAAVLDCLNCFADKAESDGYTRPVFSGRREILIKNGRHPVVERNLPAGKDYIPNDLTVTEDKNILIITGPNMSGKSTFLRQTALIVLLAQAGSFVPADHAVIGMTDRIFTRVGASDNLAGGESTFLVEMNETANILNNATRDSLIIFDEVGRGTATFDGLSLAWAIVEYIHNESRLGSRTLFATHYHELTDLERICPGVKNFHASVREFEDEIIFMRKIIEGGADSSYGIYVARLAGIPESVLKRAGTILKNLEENELTPDSRPSIAVDREKERASVQPSLFSLDNDLLRDELRKIDVLNTTPMDALVRLKELKELL